MTFYSTLRGIGACLPQRSVSNDELVNQLAKNGVESSSEWIETRTGIRQRYLASASETTSWMASQAGSKALRRAGVDGSKVEAIVVATSTADQIFPSSACAVQSALGCPNAMAFDLQAVCSGFVYALTTANALIRSGQVSNALVIGSEVFSRLMDWNDRSTCVLFGDGAGAVYLEKSSAPGILHCELFSEGELECILNVRGRIQGGQIQGDPYLRMDGQAVFKKAVAALSGSALSAIHSAGLTPQEIDLYIPHQANVRILQSVAKKLGLTESQIVSTVADHGNTSAASVPLALNAAFEAGRVKKGMKLLLQGVGGGFTWGSVVLQM